MHYFADRESSAFLRRRLARRRCYDARLIGFELFDGGIHMDGGDARADLIETPENLLQLALTFLELQLLR